jgi:hypothetical protein
VNYLIATQKPERLNPMKDSGGLQMLQAVLFDLDGTLD